jgi:transcriptional regulator with XRE-family HTH domain
MPARAPAIADTAARHLVTLGEQLRARRKQLGIAAASAAEAAGLSRVTLHRIERGEPGVTLGAWAGVAEALGLQLALVDPQAPVPAPALPARIRLADHPQLRKLAWQLHGVEELTPQEALSLYERNWRHVDQGALQPQERALIDLLGATLGKGRLLV